MMVLFIVSNYMLAQENTVRFFNLEPKPTISLLDDRTYLKQNRNLSISGNIYSVKPNRNIDMGQAVQRKENHKQYLISIYQSRLNQQQDRISQNTNTSKKKEKDANVQVRGDYNYEPYGWQDQYYRSSSLWQPSFYQQSSYGRLRANRRIF